jgi:hypothetical protein
VSTSRFASLLICIVFAASAAGAEWRVCAGVPSAHGCCESEIAPVLEQPQDCCAMSQQAGGRDAAEITAPPTVANGVRAAGPSTPHFDRLATAALAAVANPARHSVPLYLRHSSLLI